MRQAYFIMGLILGLVIAVFALQNTTGVEVRFLTWQVSWFTGRGRAGLGGGGGPGGPALRHPGGRDGTLAHPEFGAPPPGNAPGRVRAAGPEAVSGRGVG